MAENTSTYGLGEVPESGIMSAPDLDYRPPSVHSDLSIGLIGCGGISARHLAAYKKAGYRVAGLCDTSLGSARQRGATYFPEASIYDDYRMLLKRNDIEVMDILTHPQIRSGMIRDALEAGKHVLSQKPFVLDMDVGESLVELADKKGLKLAVNQNARWAPHFRYMTKAIEKGLIGDVDSIQFTVNWDHNWIRGTAFEEMDDLILYDFAIHWFDMLNCFMGGEKPLRTFSSKARTRTQLAKPPFLASVMVEYPHTLTSMNFAANVRYGQKDRTMVTGSKGVLVSEGPSLNDQTVTVELEAGIASPHLEGTWFSEGFQGTMAELLASIEQDREPANNARDNLTSLSLCFAALAGAADHSAKVPGEVRKIMGA